MIRVIITFNGLNFTAEFPGHDNQDAFAWLTSTLNTLIHKYGVNATTQINVRFDIFKEDA